MVHAQRAILKKRGARGAVAALIRDEHVAAEPPVRRVVEALVHTFDKFLRPAS